MASPQLEDGHTRIANELLERLIKLHLSPNQWQVLLCIIRKTYGFNKKVDYIANSQIQIATDLGKTVVSRALREMEARNIITRNGKVSGIQKDWERWKVSSLANSAEVSSLANSEAEVSNSANNKKLAIPSTKLAELLTKVSSPVVTQKTKDTITKDNKEIYKEKYGEFQNVLFTPGEYQKLLTQFGEQRTKAVIERLSSYIASQGKERKYKSHYATVLNWQRRDGNNAKIGHTRELPKTYTPTADYPDL